MGQTPNYGLRKPTDPNEPADFITIVGALADDTDATLKRELDGKSGTAHGHASVPYADNAGNAHSVDGEHFAHQDRGETLTYVWGVNAGEQGDNRLMWAARLGGTHGHSPSQLGIVVGTWVVGTLGPGQEAQVDVGKPAGSMVMVTVQHNSTWIYAVANALSETVVRLRCRNGTQSTTHTNIKIYYAFIPNA